jgi:PAS domain S-box-containing protein
MLFVHLILIAATIYNLILVGIILWKAPPYRGGRSFAWYILGIAAWTLCGSIILSPNADYTTALWASRATFVCSTFAAMSWLLFCADFPRRSPHFRLLAWLLTISGLPWFWLAWTNVLIADIPRPPWWANTQVGALAGLYLLWIGACFVISVIHLVHKGRSTRGLERLQVRYVLLGMLGVSVVAIMTNLIIPMFTQSSRYAFLGMLSSLFITTTTTYAIVRYRLMDIAVVLRTGLVYSLTVGVVAIVFALLVPWLDNILAAHCSLPAQSGAIIMAFIMALAFQPMRNYLHAAVNHRWFYQGVYDYRSTLRDTCDALASVSDQEMLVSMLRDALERSLKPNVSAVYLPRQQRMVKIAGTASWQTIPEAINLDDPLFNFALETDEVIVAEECLRRRSPHREMGVRLQDLGAQIAVPLIVGDSLSGMLLLGEKISGEIYTGDDINLLRILGKQAALALDNARHFEAMVQLNAYHERLLHIMQDGVIALDPQQRVITFNAAAERITGVHSAPARGHTLVELSLEQLAVGEPGGEATETELDTADGQHIPLLITVTPFTRRGELQESRLIVFRDLSYLRQLEEERLRIERSSSLGALAASIANEIKNPLVPIKTFAYLLPQKYDDDEFRQQFTEMVVVEIARIQHLVDQMLEMVQKPSITPEPVVLEQLVRHVVANVQTELDRHQVRVVIHAAPLPPLTCMAEYLRQAVQNIIVNAMQAMPDGGEITIDLDVDEEYTICRIRDTGPGVPRDQLARIFEPLYSTRPGGHGLGLTLAYQFVHSHNGDIRAENAPEGGLCITIRLPVTGRETG